MTDALVDTLRLRGPHAARLARVAATALPDALEASLADVADCRLESVQVQLQVDPDADDATIAALWAGAIRAQLVTRAGLRPAADSHRRDVRGSDARRGTGDHAAAGAVTVMTLREAMAAIEAWLSSATPRPALPASALRAVADLAALAPNGAAAASVAELAARVSHAIRSERYFARGTAPMPGPHREGAVEGEAAVRPTVSGQTVEAKASGRNPATDAGQTEMGRPLDELHELAALADLVDADEHLDPLAITGAAGLALLYPWLADLCRTATRLHPGVDEVATRAVALAAAVDQETTRLEDDPFVLLLAGMPVAQIASHRPPRAELPFENEVRVAAEEAVRSFAALLPGFAESSPHFVRREWIARLGILDADRDPVRLTAATHPLDVVLSRLPYPVGLFRLPWAPPVHVRFQP